MRHRFAGVLFYRQSAIYSEPSENEWCTHVTALKVVKRRFSPGFSTAKMYSNCKQGGPLLKVVILGDMGVGKTCLMRRLVHNVFDFNSAHTIGVDFLTKEMNLNNDDFTLQIWDTAGQEKFRSLRTPFYRGADICMLTYSVVDKASFDHLSFWKREFTWHAKPVEPFPFIVVGTKLDLADEISRGVAKDTAEVWCKENGLDLHIETSSKTNSNVDQAFQKALSVWHRWNSKGYDFSGSHKKLSLSVSDLPAIKKRQRGQRKKCAC